MQKLYKLAKVLPLSIQQWKWSSLVLRVVRHPYQYPISKLVRCFSWQQRGEGRKWQYQWREFHQLEKELSYMIRRAILCEEYGWSHRNGRGKANKAISAPIFGRFPTSLGTPILKSKNGWCRAQKERKKYDEIETHNIVWKRVEEIAKEVDQKKEGSHRFSELTVFHRAWNQEPETRLTNRAVFSLDNNQ